MGHPGNKQGKVPVALFLATLYALSCCWPCRRLGSGCMMPSLLAGFPTGAQGASPRLCQTGRCAACVQFSHSLPHSFGRDLASMSTTVYGPRPGTSRHRNTPCWNSGIEVGNSPSEGHQYRMSHTAVTSRPLNDSNFSGNRPADMSILSKRKATALATSDSLTMTIKSSESSFASPARTDCCARRLVMEPAASQTE
jgi:hypothetical protein